MFEWSVSTHEDSVETCAKIPLYVLLVNWKGLFEKAT